MSEYFFNMQVIDKITYQFLHDPSYEQTIF